MSVMLSPKTSSITSSITKNCSENFISVISHEISYFIPFTVPANPRNFRHTFSNLTSLRIEWSSVVGADFYTVFLKPVLKEEEVVILTTTFLKAEFSDLKAGSLYEIQVYSGNRAGNSSFTVIMVQTGLL